ncbi:HNH endonuclease signature motif containing protein [Gordonia sp. ABSL11-1]|uniref:HNH endonuclease n=1 Tax=Gordonia sp. ABSL11-1 TaxID=3053924 RepID=UPI002573A5FE|nr:HNH endonuclease signature motif containing protein [Gordonia sp. ABSL11-1]MDL9947306.1 HNH endonuclease signature motif containing protein [Gordonia sp. ABSL11-1]
MARGGSRRARAGRRRQRRMRLADNDLNPAQWELIKAAWGGCAYCGRTDGVLQRDCVQPLSVGGRYTERNVVPACRSCNASKCNTEVTAWMRRKKLDEGLFLRRLMAIRESRIDAEPGPPVDGLQ